jgi:hypothetical protein
MRPVEMVWEKGLRKNGLRGGADLAVVAVYRHSKIRGSKPGDDKH